MTHNRLSLYFCIVLVHCAMTALTSCSRNTGDVQENRAKQDERYRNIVADEFQNRVRSYDADTRYLILVDYSIPSNQDRLFIWDIEQDKIVEKFWCAHGNGGGSTPERPVFSNTYGSKCSSLGWYLVDRSVGISATYGYRYHAVDGKDATNSNARKREILIHSWRSVDYDYQQQIQRPMDIDGRCEGCFTTTNEGFETIDRYIKSRQKRILLYAFDGI